MIIGVPFDVVVRRTARVRLDETVAVIGLIVAADAKLPLLLLLLIMVGSDAAPGTVTLPIARVCVVEGAVTVAGVVVLAGVVALD